MRSLLTERLILRRWEDRDRDLFHLINSDERVMEFFPFRRDRAESDALMDRINGFIDTVGFSFAAMELRATGETIGFCGLHRVSGLEPHLVDGSVEIGWRLTPHAVGEGYVTEAAMAWLKFGFEELGEHTVSAFAVEDNYRSIAVMRRLGMNRVGAFDHPSVPQTHPHLTPHALYQLDAAAYRERIPSN